MGRGARDWATPGSRCAAQGTGNDSGFHSGALLEPCPGPALWMSNLCHAPATDQEGPCWAQSAAVAILTFVILECELLRAHFALGPAWSHQALCGQGLMWVPGSPLTSTSCEGRRAAGCPLHWAGTEVCHSQAFCTCPFQIAARGQCDL